MLIDLRTQLEHDGVTLTLGHIRTALRRSLCHSGVIAAIGVDHVHPTLRSAVAAHTVTAVQKTIKLKP